MSGSVHRRIIELPRWMPPWPWLLAIGLACTGCNAITGADLLSVDSGDAMAGAGAGRNRDPPAEPVPYAAGVTVTDIDLFQGIRRPLVQAGETASSDVPIVAGRGGLLRIFYSAATAGQGHEVVAQLRLSGAQPIKRGAVLGVDSTTQALDSTINIEVPGELLEPGTTFSVELLDASGAGDPDNHVAAFPRDGGMAPLPIEQGGRTLRVMLVPVSYRGELPDTSEEQLDRYADAVLAQYPVPEVQIELRDAPLAFDGDLATDTGWQELLDAVTALRVQDQAPDDTYYYALHAADGSGMEGLSWVNTTNDPAHRAGVGIGVNGERSVRAMVHELGHAHGRDHSPCNVVGDPGYPHPGGATGVWGLDEATGVLLDPAGHYDFMGYCDPSWVSDYTFIALFERLAMVSSSPDMVVTVSRKWQRYHRFWVRGGVVSPAGHVQLAQAPVGDRVRVAVRTGSRLGRAPWTYAQGQLFAYDHLDGGVLYLPASERDERAPVELHFTLRGQPYHLSP